MSEIKMDHDSTFVASTRSVQLICWQKWLLQFQQKACSFDNTAHISAPKSLVSLFSPLGMSTVMLFTCFSVTFSDVLAQNLFCRLLARTWAVWDVDEIVSRSSLCACKALSIAVVAGPSLVAPATTWCNLAVVTESWERALASCFSPGWDLRTKKARGRWDIRSLKPEP